MSDATPSAPRWCVVGRIGDAGTADGDDGVDSGGWIGAVDVSANGERSPVTRIPRRELPGFVARREAEARAAGTPLRWVWRDTVRIVPELLAAGVRVERCHDLRLCRTILVNSALLRDGAARAALIAATEWDVAPEPPTPPGGIGAAGDGAARAAEPTLFDEPLEPLEPEGSEETAEPAVDLDSLDEALAEFDRQRAAIAAAEHPQRMTLLLAAESAGALVAAELTAAGAPWDADEHDRILTAALGPRPDLRLGPFAKPARLVELAERVRGELGDPDASLDSPPKLVRALRAAGIEVSSTSRWELAEIEHPVIEPLLQYKRLSRLLSANGWSWLDEWVHDGRYRPVYIPGGVVTGRWASSGGGALQIPRQLRPALRADPGWLLVSADVSQLEPRVLAAMSGDRAMIEAAAGRDLYEGVVESGAVASRQEAKIAMLGAMYGGTTGDSGRLVPRLRLAFPAAMRLVDEAAGVGERGGIVSTWLGRSSPPPSEEWERIQAAASLPGSTPRDEERARRAARDRGRFLRNFVVQGTAAEWALAWMAELRLRLAEFEEVGVDRAAAASGPAFERRPHLAFFLHDEVIVHTPREHAPAVAEAIEQAARAAGQLLFRGSPVDFRLDLRTAERALKE